MLLAIAFVLPVHCVLSVMDIYLLSLFIYSSRSYGILGFLFTQPHFILCFLISNDRRAVTTSLGLRRHCFSSFPWDTCGEMLNKRASGTILSLSRILLIPVSIQDFKLISSIRNSSEREGHDHWILSS